jgi:hypothetical protein
LVNIIVVLPKLEEAKTIKSILVRSGYRVNAICTTGAQAIQQADGLQDGVVICDYKMPDMLFQELKDCLPVGFELLLMASQKVITEDFGKNMICLSLPLRLNDFVNTDRFTLFAAHRPDSFYFGDASEVYDIDLVVSAHIHGGQVIMPFFGGLYGGDQGWWPKYYHGYYEKNNIKWLITSGLSTSKKALPRFNNPPEIMMINLIPAN